MADTILKVTAGSGNKLSLQSGAGNSALDVLDGGNIEIGNSITTGTLGSNVSVANCIIKKWHHFVFTTRTTMNNTAGDKFTWTTSFVPLDPVNNSLWVTGIAPTLGQANDHYGFGLRFAKSGGGNTDFFNKGVMVHDSYVAGRSQFMSYSFNIAAGTLSAGTYTITHRQETADSHASVVNPSTTDNSRNNPAKESHMMIREYKNP